MKAENLTFILGLYRQESVFSRTYAAEFGIAIQAIHNNEPYAVVTVNLPSKFGVCEVIGIKNAAYMDTNNCPWVDELVKMGVAIDTGFTRESGWCTYPLYKFDEEWLKKISGNTGNYEKYLESYARCFEMDFEDCDEEEETV